MSDCAKYYIADVVSAPTVNPPTGLHPAFDYLGWGAFPVGPTACNEPTILRWSSIPPSSQAHIRLATSISHREETLIEAFLPKSGRTIGIFDLRYASVCEPTEISILRDDIAAVAEEGLALRTIQGESPAWFISGHHASSSVPEALQPHLLVSAGLDREREFIRRMLSLASLQAFGWLEGCVLDGLYDLRSVLGHDRVRPALEQHLSAYLTDQGDLRYLSTRSVYYENQIYGTEGTLPIATIAKVWPEHPVVDLATAYWEATEDEKGLIRDRSTITAEGCYIGAYPLAVVGVTRSRPDLCDLALLQLTLRTQALFSDGQFFQKVSDDGTRALMNWGRGCVWYLLGYVRTISVLASAQYEVDDSLITECRRFADWVRQFQSPDGTWCTFLDDPASGIDTSATAGIGAAYALGVNAGILPDTYIDSSSRALRGLLRYLTPDGFLAGAAPENKAGAKFQWSGYRSISQFSMGLMAQQVAALGQYEKKHGPSPHVGSVVELFGLS